MAADYFAGILLNPLALALLLLMTAALTSIHYQTSQRPPVVSGRSLLPAYGYAVVACALASALMSYVSPEEAFLKWKVPPENYWTAQWNEFISTFAFAAYATLLGIAAVGLPIIVWLGQRGHATIPTVLVIAVLISVLVSGLMTAVDTLRFRHFLALAMELVPGHVAIATAFCIGARLPWRRT